MADKSKPPLNLVDLKNVSEPDKLSGLIAAERKKLGAKAELFDLIATETWMKFSSYKNAGFSDTQALRLIIADIQKPN